MTGRGFLGIVETDYQKTGEGRDVMSITFEQESGIFYLETKESSYQIQVDEYGYLLHLYYGKKVVGRMDDLLTYYDRGFSGNPWEAGNRRDYSLDALPQEFPVQGGGGDYRSPALRVRSQKGIYGCCLKYRDHRILPGKYSIKGLPAVYASQDEAETLQICLEDPVAGIRAELLYGVLPERDLITRSVRLSNFGQERIHLEKVASACLDFAAANYELLSFYGRHAMERNWQRSPVNHGSFVIGSTRGTSSHQYNPLLILADPDTTEDFGNCYALSYVYSGGFQAEAQKDQYGQVRLLMGLSEDQFCYPLEPGETFAAPEVILTYSGDGLNRLSQKLHTGIRRHICRGKYRDGQRPILLNSWEASYFHYDGETICRLAGQARELGIDMVVLDDGWFGRREDDNSSLGDWYFNEGKMGMSLECLSQRLHDLGVKFGIWVEPEMVSEDSDLYRAHPDWVLAVPQRGPVRSRNQLVLDFSRREVTDDIYQRICDVLERGKVEYVKWDMNRSLYEAFSAGTKEPGRVLYDYMLGVYDFLERLTRRFPDLLVEGCSGGGGRFDAGMLYYAPQIWCSDNTDAVDRVRIQYGTSFGYPACAVGAHVSAVPNHQTGRVVSLHTRGIVAMAGTFGYELDPALLSEKEKEEIRQQVKTARTYGRLIREGLYYRLTNPFTDGVGAWAFVSEDGSEALFHAVLLEMHGNMTVSYVRLRGLKSDAWYREESAGRRYHGSALMAAGIPIPANLGEYGAMQLYFKEIKT